MLISTVLSPEMFDPEHFDDPLFHLNAEQLLQGINANGIVLVDKESRLYNKLCDNVEQLASTKKGKRSQILFEELLKKQRQKIVRFVRSSCSSGTDRSDEEVVATLAIRVRPDALIMESVEKANDASAVARQTKVMAVTQYIQSDVESERRAFAQSEFPSCDQMSDSEFEAMIAKATRFSKQLRFFDKMLGKGTGQGGFQQGIQKIIQIWIDNAHFPVAELSVEVYTIVDDGRWKRCTPSEAYIQVKRDLCEPVSRRFRIPVTLCFKYDSNYISHPRHLQTDSITIQFERGFDFLNRNGSRRRTFLNIVGGGDNHLSQYRQLADYDPARPPKFR